MTASGTKKPTLRVRLWSCDDDSLRSAAAVRFVMLVPCPFIQPFYLWSGVYFLFVCISLMADQPRNIDIPATRV
jgi:hypothetical protein